MYLRRESYTNAPNFLNSEAYQNITITVSDEGANKEENGKKFVQGGTLLDADGNIVKITRSGSSGSYVYALSGTPAGILFKTTEVTQGPQPGALMIDGSVLVERLPGDYVEEALQQIIPKLPFIKFFVEGKLQIKEEV